MEQLILYLSNNVTPPFVLLRNIGMQMLFLALIGIMAVNLIRPLLKYAKRNKLIVRSNIIVLVIVAVIGMMLFL